MRAQNFLITRESPSLTESLDTLKTKLRIDTSFFDIQISTTHGLLFCTHTSDERRVKIHVSLLQGIICINAVVEASESIIVQMYAKSQTEAMAAIKRLQKSCVKQITSQVTREFLSLD